MTYEQLLLEHARLIDLRFVRGHLTGAEERRLRRVRRKLDWWEQKPGHRGRCVQLLMGPDPSALLRRHPPKLGPPTSYMPREGSIPVEQATLEPFFRLELDNDDGTLFEAVEAQTKEQAEEAFFAAVGMLVRYSKREKQK